MELEARRFARKILLVHAILLCIVLMVMVVAVRVLYSGARGRAIDQAKQNQELLAKQTALGIETFYESVTGVLNLLQPTEGRADDRPSETTNAATWMSIRDKANLLIIVDARNGMKVVRMVGATDNAPNATAVTNAAREWLQTVTDRAISPYVRLNNAGMHLVAVPLRGQMGTLMVAVVPISALEQDVLGNVNRSAKTSATLIDDSGTFIAAPIAGTVGLNIREFDDPRTRALA
ncbi:MAG: cache domain-containing protein, partial [Anaerolineae bacterium]|nr:cache domain-containing protein [Phycisphaerae bacterium]